MSYVLIKRAKKRDWFALPVTERNEAVEPNPANSTRKAGAVSMFYLYKQLDSYQVLTA